MTERELLELAAKAAGWTWWHSKHGYWNLTSPEGDKHTACHNWPAYDPDTGKKLAEPTAADALRGFFGPENDSEQALELAVKLEIEVRNFNGISYAGKQDKFWSSEAWFPEGDPLAATRRAITRAAAEIGKAMP